MSDQNSEQLERDYPSIGLAYSIAVSSYDVALKRLDSVDNRLQTILAFVVTVSVSVPSIASSRGIPSNSYWFYAALSTFILNITIGIWARLYGTTRLLKPSHLFQDWLADSEVEFKKDMIYYAGEDFDANMNLVNVKWRCSVVITALFVLQAVFETLWVLSASRP